VCTQPFSKYTVNPSWLAVKPLHGAVFETDSALHPVDEEAVDMHGNTAPPLPPLIHCTVQKVPVSYESVLDRVPKFHASPPVIFEEEELPWISPPEEVRHKLCSLCHT
jgi:pyroglutamyl-peptidase